MIQWFLELLRDSKPWFRYSSGQVYLECTRYPDRVVLLTIREGEKKILLKIDPGTADKIENWLKRSRVVEHRGDRKNNVIRLTNIIPISPTPPNSDRGPDPFTG